MSETRTTASFPNIPGGEGPKDPRVNAITAILLLAVLGYLVFGMGSNPFAASGVDTLATSDFVAAVKDDRVKDVTFKNADRQSHGHLLGKRLRQGLLLGAQELQERLRGRGFPGGAHGRPPRHHLPH